MIKLRRSFKSENDVTVVIKLKKNKCGNYDVFTVVEGTSLAEEDIERYLTEVGRVGSMWYVTNHNLDNYENDYQGVSFNKLTYLIKYIGITEIENKLWFNYY